MPAPRVLTNAVIEVDYDGGEIVTRRYDWPP